MPGIYHPVRGRDDHVHKIPKDHPRRERGGPALVTLDDRYFVDRHGYAVSSFTPYGLIRLIMS